MINPGCLSTFDQSYYSSGSYILSSKNAEAIPFFELPPPLLFATDPDESYLFVTSSRAFQCDRETGVLARMVVYDLRSQIKYWFRVELWHHIARLRYFRRKLYALTTMGTIVVLSVTTGKILHEFKIDLSSPNSDSLNLNVPVDLIITPRHIYVATLDGYLQVYHLRGKGERKWLDLIEMSQVDDWCTGIQFHNKKIYFASASHMLFEISTRTSEVIPIFIPGVKSLHAVSYTPMQGLMGLITTQDDPYLQAVSLEYFNQE